MTHSHGVVDELAAFAAELREAGLPIGVGQTLTFSRAVGRVGVGLQDVYWAGRACLVTRPEAIRVYDRVFAARFLPVPDEVPGGGHVAKRAVSASPAPASMQADAIREEGMQHLGAAASDIEVLRHKWFADVSAQERENLQRLIRSFRFAMPRRRTRRMRGGASGRRPDLRRTLRRSLRTHGEVVTWS